MQFYAGPIEVSVEILGSLLDVYIEAGPIEIEVSIEGTFVIGLSLNAGPINLYTSVVAQPTATGAPPVVGAPSPSISSGFETSVPKYNWVTWSKIGSLDFQRDVTNVAGEAYIDWAGGVYEIKKLGSKAVVYGPNGITIMTPVDKAWGFKTISRIGVLCKPVGTEDVHFFLDHASRLCRLTEEGIEILGYTEFLTALTNPRMIYSPIRGLVYLCDGVSGFVYNSKFPSFGKGPVSIADIGYQDGNLYVLSTELPIAEVPFYIITDVYDFNTRKFKTINTVEVGTDLQDTLELKIETKDSYRDEYRSSKWVHVNPNGIAYCPCYGIDFKFHLRSTIYEQFKVDYFKVRGVVHGAGYLDSRQ
jgi:hypothetical protein